MTAVKVAVAVYVSSTTKPPLLIVNLNAILEVDPDAGVAVVLKIVEVATVDKLYQQDAEVPVSAEPVLQVVPLSKNF